MISKAIYSILNSSEELGIYIGSRIYPQLIDMNATTLPAVVYGITDHQQIETKSGKHNVHIYNADISAIGKKYTDVETIGNLVRLAMTSASGEYADVNILNISLVSASFENEQISGIHILSQKFEIIAKHES